LNMISLRERSCHEASDHDHWSEFAVRSSVDRAQKCAASFDESASRKAGKARLFPGKPDQCDWSSVSAQVECGSMMKSRRSSFEFGLPEQ
jgi:hypothetical protein